MTAQIPSTIRSYYFPTLGSHTNLTLQTISLPELKSNCVLVKIHAVSLQYRDLYISLGRYPGKVVDNLVPCSDMAGEVVAIGADVTQWKIGDRVSANTTIDYLYGEVGPRTLEWVLGGEIHGVLAEYRDFPAHSLVTIPEHLSYEEAAALPCAAVTAYNALMGPKPVKAGDAVLILGTSAVSLFGLQFAIASGATVIATSSSDAKLAIVKKLGAAHTINYNTTPDWDKEVLRLTDGRGVDHVLEVGGPGTLEKSMAAVRYAGHVHLIGFLSMTPVPLMNVIAPCLLKAVTLRGVLVGSLAQLESINGLLRARPESTRPVIDKVFSFEEAAEAYAYMESQKHVGKIVIRVCT
ncbi:alcohol dehydrogenase superfamily protein [Guyanagaster necrorhizus]|uniref:Alcohol dehydrogenase superfamily protein n=1 Tax=Guyanagaster necrorhizus TaxID=856835 RepID=A0A9P8ARZ6_9AGAR|nr:alcohol dehydrogenase superfamily protein [Guyanagaster necrorhizus MCA 3950]KAG7445431.1 alcohol dehydrogenase superfamily protein [Guyanagaster necrorhizus MCA 3950]